MTLTRVSGGRGPYARLIVSQPRGCLWLLPRKATISHHALTIQRRVFNTLQPCYYRYSYSSNSCFRPTYGFTGPSPPSFLPLASPSRPSSTPPSNSQRTALMTRTQARKHAGHSHGHGHGHHHHHHHHDNVYLTSKNKSDPGVRITRIGLLANLGMAVGKGVGGYVFHSQALIADAYHALTDLVSDFMTLATVSLSLKPPSPRFPTGYGKVETLGALGVSGLLLCGGVLMGFNALEVIASQFFPELAHTAAEFGLLGHGHSHSHIHAHEHIGPHINAAWLAGGSIIIKEWLYHATMRIAKQRKSSVLASNAVHHRVDSLTSIVALLTIGGSHIITDASWLDPVGGLIISMMVIKAGWANTKTSLLELADIGVDEDMIESVEKATLKAISGIPEGAEIEIRDLQGIKSGQNYLMEMELAVPGSWSVEQTRRIEQIVRQQVGSRVRGVKRLRVRFIPSTEKDVDFAAEFIARDTSPESSPEPEVEVNDKNGSSSTGSEAKEVNARKRA
ncbi:hypothetical protein VTO42DRAFT_1102 [Malbranchea cinnamomea]